MFCLCFLLLKAPSLPKDVVFFEPFNSLDIPPNWVISKSAGYSQNIGIYELTEPTTVAHERALVLKQTSSRFAISSSSPDVLNFSGKTMVLQYELRAPRNIRCSGLYIKLFFGPGFKPNALSNKTLPAIVFGPDFCGKKNEIMFIFSHLNQKTHQYEEKTMTNPTKFNNDGLNHLFTLIIRPNNTYEILIDNNSAKKGSFFSDFHPPVIPFAKIPDPKIKKPSDWDERETIVDEYAQKPSDWDEDQPMFILDESFPMPDGWLNDEPPYIRDLTVQQPKEWDDSFFGPFIPPMIPNPRCKNAIGCGKYVQPMRKNPKFKGKWSKPIISNPNFKGKWNPPLIDNPFFFVDKDPYLISPIQGIGFELLSVDGGIAFRNILLSNDEESVKQWNNETFCQRKLRQLNPSAPKEEYEAPTPKEQIPPKAQYGYKVVVRHSAFMIFYAIKDLLSSLSLPSMIITMCLVLIPVILIVVMKRKYE